MTERVIAYILLVLFFAMDSLLRKSKTAKSIEANKDDNKSTMLIVVTFFIVIVLSIILNLLSIGTFNNSLIPEVGLAIMVIGLVIRMYSMLTLSKYYTRTLLTIDKQEIIKKGLYKFIRHPGYLGTILIWSAAGIAMSNEIISTVAMILLVLAYSYRIKNEESMLSKKFGEKYTEYMKHTWRLIPFIW